MQNALQGLLDALADAAGNLSPVAKAVAAAVLPLASSLLNMAIVGRFDAVSIVTLATGAVTALAVYLVPNKARSAAPKAPAAK